MSITSIPIKQVEFPTYQYFREETNKTQIVIHHTVSGEGVEGDVAWWLKTPDRIATHIIIARDGTPYQNFSSKYWAHHLGIKSYVWKAVFSTNKNTERNQQSISVELDSWGGLTKIGRKYYSCTDKEVPANKVIEHPNGFRGYKYFERYTDEQINTLKELLEYWNQTYDIPLDYQDDMWDQSVHALLGKPGVWTHASYRTDKSDCHPQPELVAMLQFLTA